MDAQTAARWINSEVSLMPGHRVRVSPSYGNKIILNFVIDSYETNDYWYNPKRVRVAPSVSADVSQCHNEDDLCRVVYDNLMFVLAHEHREAVRYGRNKTAPFHPHHGYMGSEGDRRFQATDHLARKDFVQGSVKAAV